MSTVENLVRAYQRFVQLPWDRNLAGPQKVWFVIYDPAQERRLRFRIPEFEIATKDSRHSWIHLDLTDAFGEWMASHEYHEAYFEDPDALEIPLRDEFVPFLVDRARQVLTASNTDDDAVVALSGVGALFGLTRVSTVIEQVATDIRGRLVVFFPGQRDGSNYRLLDARDGWDYLAVPITANGGD